MLQTFKWERNSLFFVCFQFDSMRRSLRFAVIQYVAHILCKYVVFVFLCETVVAYACTVTKRTQRHINMEEKEKKKNIESINVLYSPSFP